MQIKQLCFFILNIFFAIFLLANCGGAERQINDAAAAANKANAAPASLPDGMAIFRKNCVTCHGSDGKLGLNGAKDLTQSALSVDERVNIITNGKKLMTPFKGILPEEAIKAVAEYTSTLKTQQ